MTFSLLLTVAAGLAAAAHAAPPAPIGIVRAIAAAEKALPGSVLEAELESRDGRAFYEVEMLSGGRLHDVRIDARTGRHLGTSSKRAESVWRSWFDSSWAAAAALRGPIAPRLTALERQSQGKVREVGFDVEAGVPVYEIEISAAAGTTEVHIDARTGKRLRMFDD